MSKKARERQHLKGGLKKILKDLEERVENNGHWREAKGLKKKERLEGRRGLEGSGL